MSRLFAGLNHSSSTPNYQQQGIVTQSARGEVIEISDDSEPSSDVRRPLRLQPKRTRHAPRETNYISSDSSTDPEPVSEPDVPLSLVAHRDERHAKKRRTNQASPLASVPHPNRSSKQTPYLSFQPKHDQVEHFGEERDAQHITALDSRHLMTPSRYPGRPTYHAREAPELVSKVHSQFGPQASNPFTSSNGVLQAERAQQPTIEEPPYYFDDKYGVKMFRGPGYERFPVVLGTVHGHNEICQQWDAKSRNKARASDTEDDAEFPSIGGQNNEGPTIAELQCLTDMHEILPDVDATFALERIRRYSKTLMLDFDYERYSRSLAQEVIAQILDESSYPKGKKNKELQSSTSPAEEDGTGVTIKRDPYAIRDLEQYSRYGKFLLGNEFLRIPRPYIDKVFSEKLTVFDTYIHLWKAESPYFASELPLYHSLTVARKITPRKEGRATLPHDATAQSHETVNELQAAKQQCIREGIVKQKQVQEEQAEATNLEIHRVSGSLIECQCCFDEEVPINRSVTCEGDITHFFCFACVQKFAETQIGIMRYEMSCMDSSGCQARLSVNGIEQAVPSKIFGKLAFLQQQAEVAAAGLEGLEQCPVCDFKAICDPVEIDSVFVCYNPECGQSSCRKCHEKAHLPKSCEEMKVDKGLSARHEIEEARSEAMIRICPKCKVKIIKENGCNKMRCTKCNTTMCYVCKVDITSEKDGGYNHFHMKNSKCPLHDVAGRMYHDIDADEAEKLAVQKVKADNEDLDETLLKVGGSSQQTPKKPAVIHPMQAEFRRLHDAAFQYAPFDAAYQAAAQLDLQRQYFALAGERAEAVRARRQAQAQANFRAGMPDQTPRVPPMPAQHVFGRDPIAHYAGMHNHAELDMVQGLMNPGLTNQGPTNQGLMNLGLMNHGVMLPAPRNYHQFGNLQPNNLPHADPNILGQNPENRHLPQDPARIGLAGYYEPRSGFLQPTDHDNYGI